MERTRALARKARLEGDKQERLIEVLEGRYVSKESVEQSLRKISYVVNAAFKSARQEFPMELVGLEDWTDRWAAEMKDGESALWRAADEDLEKELAGELKKVAREGAKKRRERQ